MSVKERFKEEARSEKEKLKAMSFQDKLWYIWEYYKFHIIGLVILIGVGSSIISTVYKNSFETALYCVVINNRTSETGNDEELIKHLEEYMGLTEKQQVSWDSSMFVSYGEAASEFSYATMAKISALVAAQDLDVMISDEENFLHYASMNAFMNLEQLLPADLYEKIKDRAYYAKDESGQSFIYGINLEGTTFAKEANLALDPPILGILSNSNRTDNSLLLLRYIFE